MATYLRFVPYIKKNYDYGVVIFLLTFNLISVSSYRVHDVLDLARYRFYTIIIGCIICLAMSLLILPNWSGDDLHNATINKLEGLARTIEASVNEYFQDEDTKIIVEKASKDPIDRDYRAILDSKSNDETLAFFASWEPRCTTDFHRYPWKQYVKIGVALRHFGYTAIALHGCLDSQVQAPRSIRALFQDPCSRVAEEVSKVLAELAISIKKSYCLSYDTLRDHLNEALQDLNSAIKSQPRSFLGNNNTNEVIIDKSNKNAPSGVIQPSIKSETAAPIDSRTIRIEDQSKDLIQQKKLKPTLSKIAITSLEFSETLPFAAFLSLLVEMVARLDLVIEEVEILGRAAGFKKFVTRDDIASNLSCTDKGRIENVTEFQNYNVATQVGE
ncbi:aluminum-activated malate transporter 12-like [Iris pallida]|uniref:Aluminum-activated malate transporter 12-like n=1 Tax=Iris pallida TaxID=29817 RepID=A0AAX6EKE9_IRIPA|nr:aluminum-activated malate transporter 12-like [Iris pallida]